MKAGKAWGVTEALFNRNNVEMHRIEVDAGGFCSKHKHEHKWNMFYVEIGELEILTWKDGGVIDCTVLKPGDNAAVPPGEFHQFRAITDVIAYEIYWVDLHADDIVRETVGGKATVVIGNAA